MASKRGKVQQYRVETYYLPEDSNPHIRVHVERGFAVDCLSPGLASLTAVHAASKEEAVARVIEHYALKAEPWRVSHVFGRSGTEIEAWRKNRSVEQLRDWAQKNTVTI